MRHVWPFALALIACHHAAPEYRGDPWPEANALFHQDPAWLGADGAFSVDLGQGRVLWLFGDSFVANSAEHLRSNATMVRNSVAIQHGYDPTKATMQFYWREATTGHASFLAEENHDWFWPSHGVRVQNQLVLFWSRVQAGSGGQGFQGAGWIAVRVDNPDDEPCAWTLQPLQVPSQQFGVAVGSSAQLVDGYLLTYGEREPGNHDLFLLRWPASALANGDLTAPEWYSKGHWVAQVQLNGDPQPIAGDGAPEFSVQRDPVQPRWLDIESVGFGATTIGVRTAPAPEGPWSSPMDVYTPPESKLPEAFVYAGKSHPELLGADVVVTYAANSSNLGTLAKDDSLYYPQFVRLTRLKSP